MAPLRNQRHEFFANLIVQSPKSGMSNTACYLACGYNAEGNAAEVAASRLLSSDKIRERIAELTAPVVKKSRITTESLLSELDATVQAAREAKQFGAVNGSLALIGKITGLLRDRLEVGSPGSFDECTTAGDVVDRLIEDAGSAQAALAQLDDMRRLVEERAAGAALDVTSKLDKISEWPSMSERRRRMT